MIDGQCFEKKYPDAAHAEHVWRRCRGWGSSDARSQGNTPHEHPYRDCRGYQRAATEEQQPTAPSLSVASRKTTTRLFSADPVTGMRRYFVMQDGADEFDIVTRQHVGEIIKDNKINRNLRDKRTRYHDGLEHVARIPLAIIERLAKQKIVTYGGAILDHKRFKQWMNDPDNRAFRTREGVV